MKKARTNCPGLPYTTIYWSLRRLVSEQLLVPLVISGRAGRQEWLLAAFPCILEGLPLLGGRVVAPDRCLACKAQWQAQDALNSGLRSNVLTGGSLNGELNCF
jgi:hypothetical protein